MAKYEAIEDFKDLLDNDEIYVKGDKYPKKGRAKKKRLEELLGNENNRGKPVIKEVEEEKE